MIFPAYGQSSMQKAGNGVSQMFSFAAFGFSSLFPIALGVSSMMVPAYVSELIETGSAADNVIEQGDDADNIVEGA